MPFWWRYPAVPNNKRTIAGQYCLRYFWFLVTLLLACMTAAQITSARLEVQTADEGVHLVSGYSIWRRARFALNAENPPFGKLISAAPLLWLNPDLPPEKAGAWQDDNNVAIAVPFLYRNRLPADRILFWGRVPAILLTLAFAAALAAWMRYRFGAAAALIALVLFCFDPNLIAHGRYVTSDVPASCFFFLAVIAWAEYLIGRRRALLIAAAVLSAVGVCTKFNLLLVPFVLLAMAGWYGRSRPELRPRRAFHHGALFLAVMALVIWAIYGFELRTMASDEPVARFLRLSSSELRTSVVLPRAAVMLLDPATPVGAAVHWSAAHIPIPAYSFPKGIYRLYNHAYWGHRAYLLGQVSDRGWWYYFPVAFLVKTPAGTLLLLALAALAGRGRNWPGGPYSSGLLLIAPACYFAASMCSPLDIGVRHILPVYAFLFVWAGVAVSRFRGARAWAAAACLALVVAESAAAYPHYLSFFNTLSGGSRNGLTYLADSNIDWGQDVLKLKQYMARNGLSSIALQYFGSADLAYYRVVFEPLDQAIRGGKRGQAAISATDLAMLSRYAFLRRCRPLERVGYSIYIYDLNSPDCHPAP